MGDLRLGDVIDDYCVKCRRLTNHSVVSMLNGEVAKVRCRSCYHDHDYLHEQIPPSKKDLKKAELFNAVLGNVDPATVSEAEDPDLEVEEEGEEAAAAAEAESAPEPEPVPAPAPAKAAAAKKKGRPKKS